MKIEIRDLTKSYGEEKVMEDFSYTFEHGETYVLTGESGSGKTTFLKMLAGLSLPDSGAVKYMEGDEAVAEITHDSELKKLSYRLPDISVMFQEDRLIDNRTAAENIKVFCPDASDSDIKEILKRLLPEDALDKKVSELSGGMKRRVAFARAILRKSSILLLDEPFTGLDSENISKVISLMTEAGKDRAIILASHILDADDPKTEGWTKLAFM
jgi:ABC-type multidrug transport system ATPase subunit